MRLIWIALLLPLAGCSTLTTSTNYNITPSKSLYRTHVYDWCEENDYVLGIWGPHCGGIHRAPVYSYKYNGGYYVFYPIFLGFNNIAFGPPVLPIIPLTDDYYRQYKEQTTIHYSVRVYAENSVKLPTPDTVELFQEGIKYTACALKHSRSDDIGDVFECDLNVDTAHTPTIDSVLRLSNGENIKIGYVKKKVWTYRPLVAPNGGEWNPEPYIKFDE